MKPNPNDANGILKNEQFLCHKNIFGDHSKCY